MSGMRAPIDRGAGRRVRAPPARSPASSRSSPSWPPAPRTRRGGCPRGSSAPDWSTPLRRDRPARRSARRPRRRPPSRAPRRRPSSTPSIGTNGTTSTAPRRGCSPVCVRRSMRATASLEHREDGGLERRRVAGEREDRRLCDASDEWSSSRTPGTARMRDGDRVDDSARRPSLTLGMHSMIRSCNSPGSQVLRF